VIQITFDPETLDAEERAWWTRWTKRARRAEARAVAAFEEWAGTAAPGARFEFEFADAIWADAKKWMLDHVFHGKCAYCETQAIRDPQHADHYRPKAEVRLEGGAATAVLPSGTEIVHPGYFWLAYTWSNLLPSCFFCNSGSGKGARFPATSHVLIRELDEAALARLQEKPLESVRWPGWYYLQPKDLVEIESPLLLNPYVDRPREHLVFGAKGIVGARGGSPKGRETIEVLRLRDEPLRSARQAAQEAASTRYLLALMAIDRDREDRLALARAVLREFEEGRGTYSAAIIDYIDEMIAQLPRPRI